MSNRISCPHCNGTFPFREEYVGRQIKCSRCHQTFDATLSQSTLPGQGEPSMSHHNPAPTVVPVTGQVPTGVPVHQSTAPPVGQPVTPDGGVPLVSDAPGRGAGSYAPGHRRKKSSANVLVGNIIGGLVLVVGIIIIGVILIGHFLKAGNTSTGKDRIQIANNIANEKAQLVNTLTKVRDLASAKSNYATLQVTMEEHKIIDVKWKSFKQDNEQAWTSLADKEEFDEIHDRIEKINARLETETRRINNLSDYAAISQQCPDIKEFIDNL